MKRTALFLFIAVLLVAACGPTHEERLAQLEQLEQWNRADSVMRYDSLALLLTDYFDSHGTSNERLRAHYILGRTYADLGESPAAISAYLDAAECADTTAADCDYHTLSRVYGQMARQYHKQLLFTYEAAAHKQSLLFSMLANDTLDAIYEWKMSAGAHILLNEESIAEEEIHQLINFCRTNDYEQEALHASTMLMHIYINHPNRAGELKNLIADFDSHFARFDGSGNLPQANRQYFYYKGRYFEMVGQLDSAEHYYRKVYRPGMTATEQNPMFKGLLNVFSGKSVPDSIAKYAKLYCMANDSSIVTKDLQLSAQLAASYNYIRYQDEVMQKERLLHKKEILIATFIVISIIILTVAVIVVSRYKKKQRKIRTMLQLKVRELAQISRSLEDMQKQKAVFEVLASEEIMQKSTELATIQQQNEALAQQIKESNASLARLKQEIMRLQNNSSLTSQEANALIEASPVYQRLQEKAGGCAELTDSEWQAIEKLVKTTLPGFYSLITSRQYSIRQEGRKLCFLLRLHVGLKEASVLMGISQPNISKLSKNILSRVFGEEGSGKELIKRLEYIF